MVFNEKVKKKEKGLYIKSITIQVTADCNLDCSYCYIKHKNNNNLKLEDGKKFLDKIIEDDQSYWNGYLNFDELSGIDIQFIGGEPMVNYKTIFELIRYYQEKCKKENRMDLWDNTTFGLCSNGTIYNKEIEDFFNEFRGKIDLAISIDGNKDLHDTCRVFKNSRKGSYDTVVKNLEIYRKILPPCHPINTKATISQSNLKYVFESVKHFFEDLKFHKLPMNCIHEDNWTVEDGQELYRQLKKVADWMIDEKDYKVKGMSHYVNSGDYKEFGFFNELLFKENLPIEHKNAWCGGAGKMIFLQYDGTIYNCNRYSQTAIGNPDRDLSIGHVDTGVTNMENVKKMQSVCYGTMYDEECLKCPVAKGCADCIAYCYEYHGEFKKVKTLCHVHKARSLANVYFWNKYWMKYNVMDSENKYCKVLPMNLPISEALNYVSEEEVEMLLNISNRRLVKDVKEKMKKI